jgi:anti-sigma regulatory factor (Ser/Thr protein kinase)
MSEPRRTHDGYRHEALLWDGDDQFLAGTVPFVREGLAAGQPVMAALTPARTRLLRDGLGDDSPGVAFVNMAELGANPSRIIPAWRTFADEHTADGGAVRGIGEPIWSGRHPAELAECQLHEALLNMAVSPDVPLWLLCPYDVASLSEEVIQEAHRSHPVVVDVEHTVGSEAYAGAHHVASLFARELPQVAVDVAVSHRVLDSQALRAVRADVRAHALSAGLATERSDDLVLAVHEIAANTVQYARGEGELRIWEEPNALVFEVSGPSHIVDPLVGRHPPSWESEGGRGLWLANQLCDLVQIRSNPARTTVRVYNWL